ncbi:MAG: hypothetical protein JWO47_1000 [Candidatus Saccharibacteria bacterium]|nr:hypothetical protein [Candidatus Saccharibacteria bacterium]
MQEEGNQEQQAQPDAGWVFKQGPQQSSPLASQTSSSATLPGVSMTTSPEDAVTWSASEYVGHPKNAGWYLMLAGATASVGVIVYFLTRDVVSTVVIAILGIVVGVFAARQPQVMEYALDRSGIHLGSRFYPYNVFKTFSVAEDGAFSHVTLLPLKRFLPPITVHYSPDDEEKIIKTLADYLPFEEHKNDVIENFSRRVRF